MQDNINRPIHYTKLCPEPIDVIEMWKLDFHSAQVLKYIARAGQKEGESELSDLLKAQFYLNRKIEKLRGVKIMPEIKE